MFLTTASLITIARILLIPVYVTVAIYYAHSVRDHEPDNHLRIAAIVIFTVAALSDALDGWVARHFNQLQLAESEEMREDRRYLEETAERVMKETGLKVTTCLALGNPPEQILKTAEEEKCDLIAMGSHGHKFLGDLWHGSTIDRVRHNTRIPILTVRAEKV